MSSTKKINAAKQSAMRVEYEYPPTRAIHASWFHDDPAQSDDDVRAWFLEEKPNARVRKIERGIHMDAAISRSFHEDLPA